MVASEERRYWAFLYAAGVRHGMRYMKALPHMMEALKFVTLGSVNYDATYLEYKSSTERYLKTKKDDVIAYIRDAENAVYAEEDVIYGQD